MFVVLLDSSIRLIWKQDLPMADLGAVVAGVIASIFQGVKALKDASINMNEASSNLKNLNSLVRQLEGYVSQAQLRYSNKLHNDDFRVRVDSLNELVQGFKTEADRAEGVATKKGVKWFLSCCWSATVGDELLRISYSMENQLQKWLQQQSVSQTLDEVLERYAQGLPSYLTLQPDDGYQPLHSKVERVSELLQKGSRKVVLVHGLSGIGKSSLAHYVAASCLPERFSDGSAKILLGYGCSRQGVGNNNEEYKKIFAEKIVHLLRTQLGYQKYNIDGITLEEAFGKLEKTLEGKNYLLIIDDVWEPDIVNRFIRLRGNQCKYLVTTRLYSIISTDVDKVEITKEDVAPVGKAILRYHSQMMELPALADALLERCGSHPLTITVMGQALEGETRLDQWAQAIDELCIYASSASVPNNYLLEDASNAATVFGSLEFSLKAMEIDARDLFSTFASLSWVEPIPETCLEELWRALRQKGTFRLEIAALLKGSLIGKHKSSYSYIVHDMVALYLNDKQMESLKLLRVPDLVAFAAVAPWLYRYGKERFKKEAGDALLKVLTSGNELLQAKVFETIINVCSACRQYHDWAATSKAFVALLGPGIPRLLSELSVGEKAAQSVIRFITNCYDTSDWEQNVKSLINAGILLRLRPLLVLQNESLKSMVDVLAKLAMFSMKTQVTEEKLRDMPINELIQLLDPTSNTTRNFVGNSVIKALISIAAVGGKTAVDCMFSAGLGEMIVQQIISDHEEFAGTGMKELNLLSHHYLEGGSIILDAFMESRLLEKLTGDKYVEYFQRSLIMC